MTVVKIKLFTPTNRKYPCFDYEDIKKDVGMVVDSGDDEFCDPDANAIVKRLEEKYGKTCGSKKKSVKFAAEDIMDKGIGYDLTDNFIDDSEAYDEWVPSTMDTSKGGHYVNKGPLEFKQIYLDSELQEKSESSMDEEEESEEENQNLSSTGQKLESNLGITNNNISNTSIIGYNSFNSITVDNKIEATDFAKLSKISLLSSNNTNSLKLNSQKHKQLTDLTKKKIKITNLEKRKNNDSNAKQLNSVVRLSQGGVPPSKRFSKVKKMVGITTSKIINKSALIRPPAEKSANQNFFTVKNLIKPSTSDSNNSLSIDRPTMTAKFNTSTTSTLGDSKYFNQNDKSDKKDEKPKTSTNVLSTALSSTPTLPIILALQKIRQERQSSQMQQSTNDLQKNKNDLKKDLIAQQDKKFYCQENFQQDQLVNDAKQYLKHLEQSEQTSLKNYPQNIQDSNKYLSQNKSLDALNALLPFLQAQKKNCKKQD